MNMTTPKKLIEVALPLDAINKASAREKSIRHGHPSTLHLWWARRPLAAARAVIFAQMVDDPSSYEPDEAKADIERQKLFAILEELVLWENTTNEKVLQRARDAIRESWRRTCAANADHPRAGELFDPDKLPAFHDPFAGGGALPLEAQRLGLESYASDLNPVAVLINKAMIEDTAPLRRQAAGQPEISRGQKPGLAAVDGGAGSGRRRALLRPVDARRGREAHRLALPEGRGDGRDGAGTARPQALRRPGTHGDRLVVGAHGEESEPRLCARGRATGVDVHAVDQEGEGGVCRAGDREWRTTGLR